MPVDRMLPTPEAAELIALTRELADKELAPRAAAAEATETLPEGLFATLACRPYGRPASRRRAASR